MRTTFRPLAAAAAVAGLLVLPAPAQAAASGGDTGLFVSSAVENGDGTVTLPLLEGRSAGQPVWYVVLDASRSAEADRYGVNRSNKLENAVGTPAVQRVRVGAAGIEFPATVDFRPERRVVPGPDGFPPAVAEPGAVGEAGYSPLVRLPGGAVLNAPQIANATGQADKIVRIDRAAGTVTLRETDGFARGQAVRYISTDASDPAVAALEDGTYAPALSTAPRAGDDGTGSARSTLVAFVNGQTGVPNPQRQGLNSALLDGADPLNVLAWLPNQGRYSPLWDVHPAQWSAQAVAAGTNTRQESVTDVEDLADDRRLTGPGGTRFGPADIVVNCPIISAV